MEEENVENKNIQGQNNNQAQIVGAIVLAGILIAGAILIKGNKPITTESAPTPSGGAQAGVLSPVGAEDRIIGNPQAKVALVMYEDFQCPFCGRFFSESEKTLRSTYVQDGRVELVYRDFAFLGPESERAAEAARCAGDQGKFWDYHDYLFNHQGGENQGAFSDTNLKSFARDIGLNTTDFNKCLDGNKYAQAVADSKTEGANAGVTGTPKGFIVKDGKTVATVDGAEPLANVQQKLDSALK